jgi:hypothetical protein
MIFAAIDWSEQFHCVVILDAEGDEIACRKVEHSSTGLDDLDSLLHRHAGGGEVCVAIELHDSLLVDWLIQQPYRV